MYGGHDRSRRGDNRGRQPSRERPRGRQDLSRSRRDDKSRSRREDSRRIDHSRSRRDDSRRQDKSRSRRDDKSRSRREDSRRGDKSRSRRDDSRRDDRRRPERDRRDLQALKGRTCRRGVPALHALSSTALCPGVEEGLHAASGVVGVKVHDEAPSRGWRVEPARGATSALPSSVKGERCARLAP